MEYKFINNTVNFDESQYAEFYDFIKNWIHNINDIFVEFDKTMKTVEFKISDDDDEYEDDDFWDDDEYEDDDDNNIDNAKYILAPINKICEKAVDILMDKGIFDYSISHFSPDEDTIDYYLLTKISLDDSFDLVFEEPWSYFLYDCNIYDMSSFSGSNYDNCRKSIIYSFMHEACRVGLVLTKILNEKEGLSIPKIDDKTNWKESEKNIIDHYFDGDPEKRINALFKLFSKNPFNVGVFKTLFHLCMSGDQSTMQELLSIATFLGYEQVVVPEIADRIYSTSLNAREDNYIFSDGELFVDKKDIPSYRNDLLEEVACYQKLGFLTEDRKLCKSIYPQLNYDSEKETFDEAIKNLNHPWKGLKLGW